jgi:hypothetical protein
MPWYSSTSQRQNLNKRTCHEPRGAIGPKLVPEAAEKVQELERAQASGASCEGLEGDPADEEQHKHHDEAHALHAAPAVPTSGQEAAEGCTDENWGHIACTSLQSDCVADAL